jgi:hypothetical protein
MTARTRRWAPVAPVAPVEGNALAFLALAEAHAVTARRLLAQGDAAGAMRAMAASTWETESAMAALALTEGYQAAIA